MANSKFSKIRVTVEPAVGEDTFPNIEFLGNRAGLAWLAEQILKVANAE